MADNADLSAAKAAKKDEFYTQYDTIEAEMNAYVEYNPDVFRGKTILLPCDDPEWSNFTKYFASNFDRFGLKKLISTSYARGAGNRQLTLFERDSPLYDEEMHETHGKLFTVTGDADGSGNVDVDDVVFSGYLEGDGDFRSAEVTALRDEADIIATNGPFSLFRDFLSWIMEGGKQFIILGNMNAITYKEVFPLLRDNKMWIGYSIHSGDRKFNVPDDYPLEATSCGIDPDGRKYIRVKGVRWFTNIDHGARHEPLSLMTMTQNLKYNKKLRQKLEKTGDTEYQRYDNYDAIEVPFTECIPSDYREGWLVPIEYEQRLADAGFTLAQRMPNRDGQMCVCVCVCVCVDELTLRQTLPTAPMEYCNGVMGVPITFMDKYCPAQMKIIGASDNGAVAEWMKLPHFKRHNEPYVHGAKAYKRLFVKFSTTSTVVHMKTPFSTTKTGVRRVGAKLILGRLYVFQKNPTAPCFTPQIIRKVI